MQLRNLFKGFLIVLFLFTFTAIEAQKHTGARRWTSKTTLDAYVPDITKNNAVLAVVVDPNGVEPSVFYIWDESTEAWEQIEENSDIILVNDLGSLSGLDGQIGEYIINKNSGALYKVIGMPPAGYNGGVADEVAVITLSSGNFAEIQGHGDEYVAKWFGIVGGTNVNNVSKVNAAFDYIDYMGGGTFLLPSDTIRSETGNTVPSNITIRGEGNSVFIGVMSVNDKDNVVFDNITFLVTEGNPFAHAIRINDGKGKGLTVKNCTFINTLYFADSPNTEEYHENALIQNCKFILDFPSEVPNVSPLTTYSVNTKIIDCEFYVNNADQAIKASKGGGELTITNNIFKGNYAEECVDAYSFLGESTFTNNAINQTKGGVFRMKGGALYNPINYPFSRRATISNNKIFHSGVASNLIYASGGYGQPYEDSTQSIIVSNNIIDADTIYSPIQIRGYHNASITGNVITATTENTGTAIGISSIKHLKISDNILQGSIGAFSGNSPAGDPFDTLNLEGVWDISDNTFNNIKGSGQAIIISNQDGMNLNISNNFMRHDTNTISQAIRITLCELESVSVKSNTAYTVLPASPLSNRIVIDNSTIGNYYENGNSWNAGDTSQWVVIGGTSINNNNTGNVGINMSVPPANRLDVNGNIGSSGFFLGQTGATPIGKIWNISGKFHIQGDGGRDIVLGSTANGTNLIAKNATNRIGIGLGAGEPNTTLHVGSSTADLGKVTFSGYGNGNNTTGSYSYVLAPDQTTGELGEFPLAGLQNYTYANTSGGVDAQLAGSVVNFILDIDELPIDPNPTSPTNTTYIAVQDIGGNAQKMLIDDLDMTQTEWGAMMDAYNASLVIVEAATPQAAQTAAAGPVGAEFYFRITGQTGLTKMRKE